MDAVRSIDAVAAFKALGFDIELVSSEKVVLSRAGRRVIVHRHRDLSAAEIAMLVQIAQVSADAFYAMIQRRPGSGVHPRIDPAALESEFKRDPKKHT